VASAELSRRLSELPGVLTRTREPMSAHLPLRSGGPVLAWVEVPDAEALRRVTAVARALKVPWKVHWPLEDWLMRDGGWRGVVIRPGAGFEGLTRIEGALRLGAACPWAALDPLGEAWAEMASWPGVVGATLSLKGERRPPLLLRRIRWSTGRGVEEREMEEGEPLPDLPDSVVPIEVELLGLGRARRNRRPPATSALFADEGDDQLAALTVARAGLSGARLRSWKMSEVLPNALVHLGGGATRDALLLARAAQDRALRGRGSTLDIRMAVLGQDMMWEEDQ
jgi:UDP-N-acetylmuramate dehydrogenase